MKTSSLAAALVLLGSAFGTGCTLGDAAAPEARSGGARHEAPSDATSTSTSTSPAPAPAPAPTTNDAPLPAAPTFATAADQVAAGKAKFERTCTGCHGANGSGGRAPRLVGLADGALASFDTAEDVASFVSSSMPVADDAEAYAVVAWLMQENGVDTGGRVLDPAVAKTLALR